MDLFPMVLVGCGNMGAALARGVRKAYATGEILLVEADTAKARALEAEGVGLASNLADALPKARTLVLATKPQALLSVAKDLKPLLSGQPLVISILAGVTSTKLREALGTPRVVRTMPNLPLVVGAGATALATDGVDAQDLILARTLLSAAGSVVEVAESQIDAVTGLSGSGPAYVLKFIMALEDAGVYVGLARPVARQLALSTVLGTAKMLEQSAAEPDVLRGQVTSPGGTTIYGLKALEDGGFAASVINAVSAATERSRQLGA